MINKYQKYVYDTKKLMHKVGKNWVIVSFVLLGLMGGSSFIEKANANTLTPDTAQTRLNIQASNNQPDLNSNSRLSQYINTNKIVDLANEAKSNHAMSSYADLLNMASSNHIQTFLRGAQIGTTQSNNSTWLGAFNQATKDFKAITNNGNGSNTSFNNITQELNNINSKANVLSNLYELFKGKSSTTPENAMNIATNNFVQEKLPPLVDTTKALTSIMSNSSARANYDNVINDAINLTGDSEASTLNDMQNDFNNLSNFLSTNGNGYIGSELGNDANVASTIANSLQPAKSAPTHQSSRPAEPIMSNYNTGISTFMPASNASPSLVSSNSSVLSMASSSNGYIVPNYNEHNASNNTNTDENNNVTILNSNKPNKHKIIKNSNHYIYVKLTHKILLHTNKHFTRKNAVQTIYPGTVFKIKKIVKDSHLERYIISYKHHNYFITANSHLVTNAYIQKNNFKRGHKMVVKTDRTVGEYKGLKFNRHNFIKSIKPKRKLVVKRVITIGKGELTRLELTNKRYISANKSFISVYK